MGRTPKILGGVFLAAVFAAGIVWGVLQTNAANALISEEPTAAELDDRLRDIWRAAQLLETDAQTIIASARQLEKHHDHEISLTPDERRDVETEALDALNRAEVRRDELVALAEITEHVLEVRQKAQPPSFVIEDRRARYNNLFKVAQDLETQARGIKRQVHVLRKGSQHNRTLTLADKAHIRDQVYDAINRVDIRLEEVVRSAPIKTEDFRKRAQVASPKRKTWPSESSGAIEPLKPRE